MKTARGISFSFLSSADGTEIQDSFKQIFSNVSTPDIKRVLNKSDLNQIVHSSSVQNNKDLSSSFTLTQLEVTSKEESAVSTESGEQTGKTDIEPASTGNNILLLIIISLNSFAIVIVCCVFSICVYCKRKLIFHKLFDVNKDGNVCDRNRLHEKRIFFREILHKSQDFDLEITNMGGNSLQRFTNDNDSGSLEQRRHLDHDLYESEPDPYLVPETNVTEPEYHPYLTVV